MIPDCFTYISVKVSGNQSHYLSSAIPIDYIFFFSFLLKTPEKIFFNGAISWYEVMTLSSYLHNLSDIIQAYLTCICASAKQDQHKDTVRHFGLTFCSLSYCLLYFNPCNLLLTALLPHQNVVYNFLAS